MDAIQIRGLRKSFRRRLRGRSIALDGLDLDVPAGGVFGFLGPNGSGKTTTIRCLLGLVRPDAGSCRVLGKISTSEFAAVAPRVGSIVETPALFPHFSGRANLELLAQMGGISKAAVDAALERVGLSSRANDNVRSYSLGMKQRLGLAAVLMKDPSLLILDEPANGLDPAGLKEIRDLLRSLADGGRTVFLSSHLLGEVEQICDHVAIVSRGRCIATGPVSEILSGARTGIYVVGTPNQRRAAKVLRDAGFEVAPGDGRLLVRATSKDASRITRALAEAGIYLSELREEHATLESVFLGMTGDPP